LTEDITYKKNLDKWENVYFLDSGTCILSSNATEPDSDGKFTLNWSISERAVNYSLYSHISFIYKIENNGTLIANNLTTSAYNFTNFTTGFYYYVIMAYNDVGSNMSNCVIIHVGRIPLQFNISLIAGDPDTDGSFTLKWSVSNFSINYSIYVLPTYISEINHSLTAYKILTPSSYPESGYFEIFENNWVDGTYYIRILAKNEFGDYLSNIILLLVEIPNNNNGNDDPPKEVIDLIWILSLGFLLGLISITFILHKKKNITQVKIQKQKEKKQLIKKKNEVPVKPKPNKKLKHNPKRKD